MKWLIYGTGITGQGIAKLLQHKEQEFTFLSDTPPSKSFPYPCFTKAPKEHFDNLVLSPSIALDHPTIKQISYDTLYSEFDLASHYHNQPTIAVTGTNGKSTVVAMIQHILTQQGVQSTLCGNIGTSYAASVVDSSAEVFVLEVSSYQMEQSSHFQPTFSLFTNFAEDHLARHKTLKAYFKAKWKILTQCKSQGFAAPEVLNQAKEYQLSLPKNTRSVDYIQLDSMPQNMVLKHNRLNALHAATLAGQYLDQKPDDLVHLLCDFTFLPHRCEIILQHNKKYVFNDSKATNLHSVKSALTSLEEPFILFLGGESKEELFSEIQPLLSRAKSIICFGEYGSQIANQLQNPSNLESHLTLQKALEANKDVLLQMKDHILFSPGCPSFDEFENFSNRGDYFREFVLNLHNKG